MTALEKYLLEGLHNVTQNNDICPVVQVEIARSWALLQGATQDEARMYGLLEMERLISQKADEVMDLQEQIGKARLTIGGVRAKSSTRI